MTDPDARPKRPHARWQMAVLSLVGAALCAGFIGLGLWQLERRVWKLDLIERVSRGLQAPAIALPPAASWPSLPPDDFEYRHVRVQGHWLTEKTVLTQATTAFGQGFWVLTPLQQADGTAVLVNRGFVPGGQRDQWLPPATGAAADGPVTVQGLLRTTEPDGGFLRHNDPVNQRWYSRDVAAIARAGQLPVTAPFFVDAGLPDPAIALNPEAASARAGTWPRQGLTVVRFSNSHLVYALTWFGLAMMVVGSGVLVARYERSLRRALSTPTAHAPPT